MLKLIIRNFYENKKTSIVFLLSIIFSSMLIFLITLLFSAVHKYLLNEAIKNTGDYHVKIKTDLKNYENFSVIKNIKWQDDKVLITYDNIYDVYKLTDKLCKKAKCAEIEYNDAYLSLYGISKNENLLNTLKYLIIIVLAIILICMVFIIYNVYKILLINKYKQIGLLQSIGMTLKELRFMLLFEAIIFSLLGIVVGFIISLLAILVLITFINNSFKIDISFALNIKFLFYAFVFLFLLILIICFIPFFKAKKISNLKLLNMNYTYKKNKSFKNIIIFLSYLNYKRSKSHYKSVIISLVIFIVLSSSFNMFLKYGEEVINNYVSMPSYDAEITVLENTDEAYKLLDSFASKNSSKYKIYETCKTKININRENYVDKGPNNLNLYIIEGNNYFINEANTVITKDNRIYKENKSYFKKEISLKVNNKTLSLKESKNIPFGFENILTKDNLLIGINNINDICTPNLTLFMKSDEVNLEKKLKSLLKEDFDLYYINAKEGKKIINNIILSVKVFLYSILVLTFLIGVSTIISSAYLSMMYRKKEFGLLKSIGLTTKDFKDMITVESLYITGKASLYSLLLVLGINVITNSVINEVIDLEHFSLIKPFLCTSLISLIMIRIIMRMCYKRIEKTSIINLIYNDNI